MTYAVAFDDKPLSRGALRKATEYAAPEDREVVVIAVIPTGNVPYYRKKKWISAPRGTRRSEEMGDATAERVSNALRGRVRSIAPEATFEPVITDLPEVSTSGIAKELRAAIADHEASDVFVGARDPKRLVSALIDPRDTKYHLHMIRRPYIPSSDLAQYS